MSQRMLSSMEGTYGKRVLSQKPQNTLQITHQFKIFSNYSCYIHKMNNTKLELKLFLPVLVQRKGSSWSKTFLYLRCLKIMDAFIWYNPSSSWAYSSDRDHIFSPFASFHCISAWGNHSLCITALYLCLLDPQWKHGDQNPDEEWKIHLKLGYFLPWSP